jgi:hypothetical protein
MGVGNGLAAFGGQKAYEDLHIFIATGDPSSMQYQWILNLGHDRGGAETAGR